MKFTIPKSKLSPAALLCKNVARGDSVNPVTGYVLITAHDDHVICAATDLTVTVQVSLPVVVEQTGALAVTASDFQQVVKSLLDGGITVQISDGDLQVSCGSATFKLTGLSAAKFPALPAPPDTGYGTLSAATLRDLIGKVKASVSRNVDRQHLAGAYVAETDGDAIVMVSTDGHRLSKAVAHVTGGWPTESQILIPRKALLTVASALGDSDGDSELAVVRDVLYVRHGGVTVATRLIDARFPNWRNVIPTSYDKQVSVGKAQLTAAIERVALVCEGTKKRGIVFKLGEDTLTVTAKSELGDADEALETIYSGPDFGISVNADYLLDALGSFEAQEAVLKLNEELDPCVVAPSDSDEYLGVIMPMRM